jgi:hypothetical protein
VVDRVRAEIASLRILGRSRPLRSLMTAKAPVLSPKRAENGPVLAVLELSRPV